MPSNKNAKQRFSRALLPLLPFFVPKLSVVGLASSLTPAILAPLYWYSIESPEKILNTGIKL
jgi:hypothetical protein